MPVTCGGCGTGLAGTAEVAVTRRQVFDIPDPTVVVTEHQTVTVACGCGHRTSGVAPTQATAPVACGPRVAGIGVYLLHGQFLSIGRTAAALRNLFGLPVAAATVSCWGRKPKMISALINKAQRMYDSRHFTMAEIAASCAVTPMTIYRNIRTDRAAAPEPSSHD